jgi:hypothetical protein
MGYRSTGYGSVQFKPENKRKINRLFKSEGLNTASIKGKSTAALLSLDFGFYDWKMYYAGKFFRQLAALIETGYVKVEGEEAGDIWQILFKDGKVGIQKTEIMELQPSFEEAAVREMLGGD